MCSTRYDIRNSMLAVITSVERVARAKRWPAPRVITAAIVTVCICLTCSTAVFRDSAFKTVEQVGQSDSAVIAHPRVWANAVL